LTFESSDHNFVFGHECTKKNALRLLAQKGCASLIYTNAGASIIVAGGSRPPRFWAAGSQVGSWGSWNIIISYNVQKVCSKVVTF